MLTGYEDTKLKVDEKDLIRACCRAIYLWEFGDDAVAENVRRADKELLKYFGTKWTKFAQQKNKNLIYDITELQELMFSCHVPKQINNPNLNGVDSYLSTNALAQHNYVLGLQVNITARLDFAKTIASNLADELKNKKNMLQPALASRILFFTMPEIHHYNYSEPLRESLKENYGLVDDNLKGVYERMTKLLYEPNNFKILKNLPRPNFPNNLKKAVKDGDWWERRVLDLAVVQNWKCFCKER